MTNKSAQKTWRSRLAVAAVGLGLAVAGTACSEGIDSPMSPSGASPASLAANAGQSTRNFSVTIAPTSLVKGVPTTLRVTVLREPTSGQNQQLGSVEINVPAEFTLQSVSGFTNSNWMGGFSGQTVRVGASGTGAGTQKLDATTNTVAFDLNVTATKCGTFPLSPLASNETYPNSFNANWTYTGLALSVTVTGCDPATLPEPKAAPAVANDYLDSIGFEGARGDIITSVTEHMTQGARFDGIDKKNVEEYKAAVIAYVIALL